MTVIRFILVTCLTAGSISLLGRMVSDFDEPPQNDPHDLLRGLGIWVIAILIAFLMNDDSVAKRCQQRSIQEIYSALTYRSPVAADVPMPPVA